MAMSLVLGGRRMPDGTMHGMAERLRGFAHRVDISAEVPVVWSALTELQHLVRWCAPDAQLRPKAGGLFRASVDRVTQIEAHIDVFEPGRRLRLIYLPSAHMPESDTAVVVDFILEGAASGGTIVRVLGSGIPDGSAWETPYKRIRVGWERALARLKVFVETQMGTPEQRT